MRTPIILEVTEHEIIQTTEHCSGDSSVGHDVRLA